MSDSSSLKATYARISRRELHSPRSVLAIVIAVAVVTVCGWLGTEIVLHLLDLPPLLATPADLSQGVESASMAPALVIGGIATVCALLGVVLLVAAVTPGRRGRHLIHSERTVAVVDDEVIASALAGNAARVAGIDPDNTRVSVSHRLASVHLVPTSGQSVHRETVLRAVSDQLEELQLQPGLRARVLVALGGKVGA